MLSEGVVRGYEGVERIGKKEKSKINVTLPLLFLTVISNEGAENVKLGSERKPHRVKSGL